MGPRRPAKAYGGRTLGRDDPMWQYYVKESSKHDRDMIEAWNKNMDVLLVFAALFSAVVTAFLIESYKNLKPDVEYITAANVNKIAALVESIVSGQLPSNATTKIPSLDEFQPSPTDISINTLWFCSLALGLTVSLITMLVKQWGEAYLYGRHFTVTPYYVQARTRQARFNQLNRWKLQYVLRTLQIMMHASLGLFLWGLILLLRNFGESSMLWVSVTSVCTFGLAFYVFATVIPLFSLFSPYHTPLSFRRIANFCTRLFVRIAYRLVNSVLPPSEHIRALPSSGEEWSKRPAAHELAEWKVSTKMAPDNLTASAVIWLASHAQDSTSVDLVIHAIAGVDAGPEFWDHVIQPDLIVLIAQRFASFFIGTLGLEQFKDSLPQPEDLDLRPESYLKQAVPGSQALTQIAKHSEMSIDQFSGLAHLTKGPTLGAMVLSEDQLNMIQLGLLQLSDCENIVIKASGLCGISAWRWAWGVGRRGEQGMPLQKIVELLSRPQDTLKIIDSKLLASLVEALAFEISNVTREDLGPTFYSVIKMCSESPRLLEGPVRNTMSATLAVIAALLNDYPSIPGFELNQDSEHVIIDKPGICAQYKKAQEAFRRNHLSEVDEHFELKPQHLRQWRAMWITELCVKNPGYLETNSDALLFFGLAGILRSYQMSTAQFGVVVNLFTTLLEGTPFNQSFPTTLPFVLSSASSIRSIVAEGIISALSQQENIDPTDLDAHEDARTHLLRSISVHGRWIKFHPELLIKILRLLKSTQYKPLQIQCLITLDDYWFLYSASGLNVYNLPPWQLFVDLGHIRTWVETFPPIDNFVQDKEQTKLQRCILSCFVKLARTIKIQQRAVRSPAPSRFNHPVVAPTQNTTNPSSPNAVPPEILAALGNLLLDDRELFGKFAGHIVCGEDPEIDSADLAFWKNAILYLPGWSTQASIPHAPNTAAGPSDSATTPNHSSQVAPADNHRVRELLFEFCDSVAGETGNLRLAALRDELRGTLDPSTRTPVVSIVAPAGAQTRAQTT